MDKTNSNMIPEDISTLGFEESFKLLENVVTSLETGGLPLKEAVDLYQQGMSLTEHCSTALLISSSRQDKHWTRQLLWLNKLHLIRLRLLGIRYRQWNEFSAVGTSLVGQ